MISIRPGTAADAAGIAACLRRAFEPYQQRYTAEAYRATVLTAAGVVERMQTMTTFVARTGDGAIVGTVAAEAMQEATGHLRGMAVDPSSQGAGVADLLLEAAEQHLRSRGCSRVTLDTTAPLTRAIRFYERQGYRPSGHVGTYFGMQLFEYVKQL